MYYTMYMSYLAEITCFFFLNTLMCTYCTLVLHNGGRFNKVL